MTDQVILKIRFPFETPDSSGLERIAKFESFFYNIFHLMLKRVEVMAFEIVQINGIMDFYIVAPRMLVPAAQSFVYGIIPDASIDEVQTYDHLDQLPGQAVGFHPRLKGSEAFSLRSFRTGQGDPLNAFFNLLSSISSTDAVFYQVLVRTIDESLTGEEGTSVYGFTEKQDTEETKPKFSTTIRMLYFPEDAGDIKTRSLSFENVFSSFSTEHNHIQVSTVAHIQTFVDEYFKHTEQLTGVFTTEEIASFFHVPDPADKIRGVDWLYSRRAEPPMNLPSLKNTPEQDMSLFGETNFRGQRVEFGIKREDRRRHLYAVGKSGTGKSKLLEKLISDDIKAGKGVCVIDPHGDLVQALLYHIPQERIDDLVYFNPADLEFPIAFNPIANVSREFKQQVAQGMIEIFKKFFGADWTPKIEHVFRFTVLALLDYKKATLMGMQKMLTDRPYRQGVITEIQDHVVKKFWANEFSSWSEKFDNEAIVPLVNKLGQFLSNEMVRNIVSQTRNKIDFDDVMNNQRILLVELSKGKLGEENSALLGSLIITKIEQTGMARAFVSAQERKDFYLYVDEVQNFATKTFDNILSEARKYRLNLTISHQYLGQLLSSTRETVFGNVGSMITFRLGAEDATYIANEFTPRFTAYDVMNLGVREMYVKMSIDGVVAPPFSARTMEVEDPDYNKEFHDRLIQASRSKYATPLAEVEEEIAGIDTLTINGNNGNGKGGGGRAGMAPAAEQEDTTFEAPLV